MKNWFFIFGAVFLFGCDTHTSPTGRSQTLIYSSAEMQQMGQQSFAEIKKQADINHDGRLNNYVDCIANRIINTLPKHQQQNWQWVIFNSPQINAFALPGGYIGIYTGMLKAARTQDELAAVLAHEVAHVLANHGNEQLSRSHLKNVFLRLIHWGLNLAGVDYSQFVIAALGMGAEVGISLPFGRKQETEADVMGLELMAKAGFNPNAAVTLWRNMAKLSKNQPLELLSTHPSNQTRIDKLQSLQAKVINLYNQAKNQHFRQCRIN